MRRVVLLLALAGCNSLGTVNFQVGCKGDFLIGDFACTFTNTGTASGNGCATITLSSKAAPNRAITSVPVCSGPVAPKSSATVGGIVFPGDQPVAVCAASGCEMKLILTEITRS